MKLYDKNEQVQLVSTEEMILAIESKDTIDKDISKLDSHIKAFNSLIVVEQQITQENYNFIDNNNYVLYNEYIHSITRNLDMKYIPILSQETVATLPTTALNHHIALEGFIGDMWKKIKEIFSKIYNSIKEFFKKYFTRLGRLKNKLKNLAEVLIETDKDLKKVNLDSVPGGLAKKYPVNEISLSVIDTVNSNMSSLVDSLIEINKKASEFSNKDILDKDFINNIKKLKEDIKNNQDKIKLNDSNKKSYTELNDTSVSDTYKHNNELNKENKTLEQEAKDKNKELDKSEKTISDTTGEGADSESTGEIAAKKEFKEFIDTLVKSLDKVKGKPLINGKVITKISGNEDDGLELETEEKSETVSSIQLNSKNELLKLVKETLVIIEKTEKLVEEYGKVNDKIMHNIEAVDKLISSIDSNSSEGVNKYGKVLNNKVKVRLNIVKTFFNNYNKVAKNILEIAMDSGDGVVDYCVLSIKNFG